MALTEKYQPLIDLAGHLGINLDSREEGGVLNLSGAVPSEEHKNRLFEEYNRLDPDMRSGDLVLNLEVSGGGAAAGAAGGGGQTYTVQRGDTLSEIGQRHGVAWREIFEANRDQLDDPDKIQPGQTLRIPGK